jgi:hypothetical protein
MVKVEEPQLKRWKPGFDEKYYYVDNDGRVEDAVSASDMRSRSSFECWCYLTGNCFETEEEAEEYKKQIEYTAKYKNYIEEHSEPLDWNNENQEKYCVRYHYIMQEIEIVIFRTLKFQGTIYASSKQIIWDAIKEIGEDNFKKYVLGVK